MSDFGLNSTLGRDVEGYEGAVKRYQQKLDWYNSLPILHGRRVLGTKTVEYKNPDGDLKNRTVSTGSAPSVKQIEGQAPSDPFKGATLQGINEAAQNVGHADELRAAPGMIALALGRKTDE